MYCLGVRGFVLGKVSGRTLEGGSPTIHPECPFVMRVLNIVLP